MRSPESLRFGEDTYIANALDFLRREKGPEKEERDVSKAELIDVAMSIIDAHGTEQPSIKSLIARNGGLVEIELKNRRTKPVSVNIQGEAVGVELEELNEVIRGGMVSKKVQVRLLSSSGNEMIGNKSAALIGVENSEFISDFRGNKAELGDIVRLHNDLLKIREALESSAGEVTQPLQSRV